ncbi:MAG TPA: Pycsar system effector family protein [Chryseolinea sp.]|nr:Pycsar system effector family protein [Chryseolinea sp.]
MESALLDHARSLAGEVFKDPVFEKYFFHNLRHTEDVVSAVKDIGMRSELTADEMEITLVAAWLHDLGYRHGAENHEDASARIAEEFMDRLQIPSKKIKIISSAILSTRFPQQPRTLIERVLCDADLYHLSNKTFEEKSKLLREEWKATGFREMTDQEWIQHNMDFMDEHRYHTPYGQTLLAEGKKKNIKQLKKTLEPEVSKKKYRKLQDEVVKLQMKLDKMKVLKPDRGIETMFRLTSHNHILLSQMVDSKASILITINSIILSLVVSVLIRKLEENVYLLYPTVILISVCLATMVFSILASRPNISSGKFTREDIKNKRTNLLFFGNFHAMKLEDYEWGMKEMMKDADYLYGSLMKDIYFLGKVLGKKYRYLRIAYSIFMYGFVLAILSFIVAFQLSAKADF